MERCGIRHVGHILVRKNVGIEALFFHLLHDQANISRGLSHMVARILVSAFHQVRKNIDKAVLHVGNFFALCLQIFEVTNRFRYGLRKRFIEVFYLITR